jgi:hypothetical protein
MTLTIQLTPEEEARLVAAAHREGLAAAEYARRRLMADLPAPYLSARELLRLSPEEQGRYLSAAAEVAAPIYAADLALPLEERELTAISAVAGSDYREDPVSE